MNFKMLLFVASLFLVACQPQEVVQPTQSNYIPLAVGNYWIYEMYRVDSMGNHVLQGNSRDSVYIESDTIIGGLKYYKRVSNSRQDYIRLTQNGVVDHTGKVVFSTNPSISLLDSIQIGNGFIVMDYAYATNNNSVQVGAGQFNCMDWKATVFERKNDGTVTPKPDVHDYYQENIGKIQTITYFYSTQGTVLINLERYNVSN